MDGEIFIRRKQDARIKINGRKQEYIYECIQRKIGKDVKKNKEK
jgi:hypothetical protein